MLKRIDNMFFLNKLSKIHRMTVIMNSSKISNICIYTKCEKYIYLLGVLIITTWFPKKCYSFITNDSFYRLSRCVHVLYNFIGKRDKVDGAVFCKLFIEFFTL